MRKLLRQAPKVVMMASSLCLVQTSIVHAQGEAVYHQCIACHTFGYSRTGPDHCGLLGRTAGTLPGFEYTPAMRDSGIVWNEQTLDRFLSAPLETVPGTSMGFIGIKNPKQRKLLIDFLIRMGESGECRAKQD